MAGGATVGRGRAGRLVVRKVADDADTAARLRHEAAVLARLAGVRGVPGAAWITGDDIDDDIGVGTLEVCTLEIDHVGSVDLASASVPLREVAQLVAALANTLAEVHERGVVHGRVERAHVVLAADGTPSLVGFGAARVVEPAGDGGPQRTTPTGRGEPHETPAPEETQPASGEVDGTMARPVAADGEPGPRPVRAEGHGPPGTAVDVAGLGALLSGLLEDAERPASDRRRLPGRGRSRPELDDALRTRLGAIAAAACHRDPDRRPTMRMLADALEHERDSVTSGRHRTSLAVRPSFPRVTLRSVPVRLLAAAATVATVSAAATVVLANTPTDPPSVAAAAEDRGAPAPTSLPPPAGPAPTIAGASTGPPRRGVPDSPLTPAGPTSAADTGPTHTGPTHTGPTHTGPTHRTASPTNTIEHDGRRYELGRAGDVVAVVDPRCSGTAAAVLLRPATGELFRFDGWATDGAELAGRLVGRFPGATSLEASPAGAPPGRCTPLTVVLADGDRQPLTAEELQ